MKPKAGVKRGPGSGLKNCTKADPMPKEGDLSAWIHPYQVVSQTTFFDRVRCPHCGDETTVTRGSVSR